MDAQDQKLIERFASKNSLLRTLYTRHRELDQKILKLSKKSHLTPIEEQEEQRLKRLKLAGKDKMMKILEQYR